MKMGLKAVTLCLWVGCAAAIAPLFTSTPAEAYTAREIYEFSKKSPGVAGLYLGGIIDAYARLCGMEDDPQSLGYGDFLKRFRELYLFAVLAHGVEAEEQNATIFSFYVFEAVGDDITRQTRRSCGRYEDLRHLAKEASFKAGAEILISKEILARYPEIDGCSSEQLFMKCIAESIGR